MIWTCGITTVPNRPYFGATLASVERAGFPAPRVFVDSDPRLGVFGRWATAIWELLIRNPTCHRYAMFQDDVELCSGLREYLDACPYPAKGYWNLFTYGKSERVITGKRGWVEGALIKNGEDSSFDPTCTLQKGQGALALVFDRDAVVAMLSQPSWVVKPISDDPNRRLDGAIVTAMNGAGYREMVHAPSLCQHTGALSECQKGKEWKTWAMTYRGSDWDARSMLVG